jgi:hypothetical protein
VIVQLASGDTMKMVAKATAEENLERAAALGTAREALFYSELAPRLATSGVPRAWYAAGKMETGEMLILMEWLEDAVPSGVFFGAGNPNNWSVSDRLTTLSVGNPSAEEISSQAFALYAKLHGEFFRDPSLLEKPWLRGSEWLKGDGEGAWRTAQQMASDAWARLSAARRDGTSTIRWDAHLVACLDESFRKVGWTAFREELSGSAWSLVHGDCHPHNALWVHQRTPAARLSLIDFEMVGVGSNAQELGQYLISHMEPVARRGCERRLIEAYHRELIATLRARGCNEAADSYTLDDCWTGYVAGGAGRWAWFVPYLAFKMPALGQFFHDQLAAFLHDHVPDPARAPMPRT